MALVSYRDLRVWQTAMDVAQLAYEVTENFPKKEMYGMVSQIRRAAISIPSNIAEGHARKSPREFSRYLTIAMGSVAELETQVFLAERFRYVDKIAYKKLLDGLSQVGKMLHRLRVSVQTNDRLPETSN